MRGVAAQLESTGQRLPICWQSDDSPAAGSAYIEEVGIIRDELRGLTADVRIFQRHNSGTICVYKTCTVGKVAQKSSGNRLTFDTKGWNHYFRRADRSVSADVTFFFMGSSLLRIWNS